jgi:hypothetical protein
MPLSKGYSITNLPIEFHRITKDTSDSLVSPIFAFWKEKWEYLEEGRAYSRPVCVHPQPQKIDAGQQITCQIPPGVSNLLGIQLAEPKEGACVNALRSDNFREYVPLRQWYNKILFEVNLSVSNSFPFLCAWFEKPGNEDSWAKNGHIDIPNVGPTTLQWHGFWSVPHWKQIGKMGKNGTSHMLEMWCNAIRMGLIDVPDSIQFKDVSDADRLGWFVGSSLR